MSGPKQPIPKKTKLVIRAIKEVSPTKDPLSTTVLQDFVSFAPSICLVAKIPTTRLSVVGGMLTGRTNVAQASKETPGILMRTHILRKTQRLCWLK